MPRGFTDSPSYFSKILKSDLDDIIFPKDSTLLQYVDDLVLGSSSQVLLKYDSIHLVTLLALKEHKVSKEKLRFAQAQVRYLGHLILEQSLRLDPGSMASYVSQGLRLSFNYEVFLD